MVLEVKVSRRQSHSLRSRKLQNKDEIAELESIQSVVSQMAVQAATAVVMTMREADVGPLIRCKHSNVKRNMQTKTWWTRIKATILYLECFKQICRIVKFQNGSNKDTSN